MLKWVLTLCVLGALAAAIAWFPIHGRTVADRWRAAPSATEFARRTGKELQTALGMGHAPRPAQATAKAPKSPRTKGAATTRPAQPQHPTESHTDEDRAALDRLVAERAGR